MSGVTIAKARTRPVVGDSTALAIALRGDRLKTVGSERVNSELDGVGPTDVQWAEQMAGGIRLRAIGDLSTDDPYCVSA